jgi:arylsulfatase A-like enzyme
LAVFFVLVFLLAAGLRFYELQAQSVWQAEICGLDLLSHATSLHSILFDQTTNRESTPLYFILLHFVYQPTGGSLWALRAAGIFLGLLSLPLIYACGRRLMGQYGGMLAALWLALSPYHIIKCRDIRPYPLVLLLGLVSAYTFIRILEQDKKKWWVINIAANVLLVWTHALGCWLLLAEGVILLLFLRKPLWRMVAWSAGHFIFLIPLAVLMAGRYSLVDPPLYSTFSDWMSSCFYMDAFRINNVVSHFDAGYHAGPWPPYILFLIRLFPALFAALLVFTAGAYLSSGVRMALGLSRVQRAGEGAAGPESRAAAWQIRKTAFLLLWAFVPPVMLVLVTVLWVPLFQQRYIVYVLPATYLIVADALLSIRARYLRVAAAFTFTLILGMMSLLAISLPMNGDYHRAARHIESNQSGAEPVLLIPGQDVSGLPFSFKDSQQPVLTFNRMHELLEGVESQMARQPKVWVVFDFIPDTFSRARSGVFERYCALRGLDFDKTVFLGSWDIVLFHCSRGAGYLPWSDPQALARFMAPLGDDLPDASLHWHAAGTLEKRGRHAEAADEYRKVLEHSLNRAQDLPGLSQELMVLGFDDWGGPDFSDYSVYEAVNAVYQSLLLDKRGEEATEFFNEMRLRFPNNEFLDHVVSGEKVLRPDSPPEVPVLPPETSGSEASYRLDENLEHATIVAAPPDAAPKTTALALVGAGLEWTAGKESSLCRYENEVLTFTARERDYIQTPETFRCYGPEMDAISLRMNVSGTDQVLLSLRSTGTMWEWADDDGHALIPIAIPEQGKEHDYLIKIGGLPMWQGREIDGLRIIAPKAAQIALRAVDIRARTHLFPDTAGRASYRLGNSLRPCLYMRGPVRATYRLRLPNKARFTASLGLVIDQQPATFSLDVSTAAGTERCFTQRVTSKAEWMLVNLDLGKYAQAEAEVILAVEPDTPGQIALWGNPIILQEEVFYPEKPNILFYVVDSLRADHLDLYGYDRPTAPALTDLARRGAWFQKCIAPSTCTRSSMVSILAGVETMVHGLDCWDMAEPASLRTFPEVLRKAGYTTAAFTENPYTPPNVPGQPAFCMVNDFDELLASRDGSTFAGIEAFLREERSRPFFAYVHTMECHVHFRSLEDYGYYAPPQYEGRWARAENDRKGSYDECIRFADDNFARVLGLLKELGMEENTLVIFTSDHGEGFGQHPDRIVHGYEPYDELVGVPLVMYWPKGIRAGQVIASNVQSLDLPRTLLDILDLEPLEQFQGASLAPFLRGASPPELLDRVLFAHEGQKPGPDETTISVMKGNFKLFGQFADPGKALFDLERDPLEMSDCTDGHLMLKAELEESLEQHWTPQLDLRERYAVSRETGVQILDLELNEVLTALGYLGR